MEAEAREGNQRIVMKLKREKPFEATAKEIPAFLHSLEYVKPNRKPSRRAVYNWISELEKNSLIRVKGVRREGKGKPEEVYELTDKGKDKRLLINERFKAEGLLTNENDILFTIGPNREYLTLHVATRDKELIEIVWKEIERLTKESGFDLKGRKRDVFFKNHPIFEKIANSIFLYIYAMLKLRSAYLPSEKKYHDMVQEAMKLFPFLQTFINSNREGINYE